MNIRFTDINGNWVDAYNVPMTDGEIDYVELGEREEEEVFAIVSESVKQEEIDAEGNII